MADFASRRRARRPVAGRRRPGDSPGASGPAALWAPPVWAGRARRRALAVPRFTI